MLSHMNEVDPCVASAVGFVWDVKPVFPTTFSSSLSSSLCDEASFLYWTKLMYKSSLDNFWTGYKYLFLIYYQVQTPPRGLKSRIQITEQYACK